MDIFCTYEQQFGLSGHPFASTRDPGACFESRGHRRAFALLRHAVLDGGCFMVLTGDTGTGKTMLLHRLLAGLESEGIVATLPIGTALGARELLGSILSGFRAPVVAGSLTELHAGLQAFLRKLASTGRRGLVAVDEAQHLLPDAIEALMELATLQSNEGLPLQVLLAGQRQLRTSLANAGHVMRQPLFLFCDVGLLSQPETREYIEHRLRHVGWNESPSFADDAHEQIFRATDGVPRRINQLCHRLLMAACRRQATSISAELVEQTHAELRAEMGYPVADASARFAPLPPEADETSPPPFTVMSPPRSVIPALFTAVDDDDVHLANCSGHGGERDRAIPTLTSIVADNGSSDFNVSARAEPGPGAGAVPAASTIDGKMPALAPSSEPASGFGREDGEPTRKNRNRRPALAWLGLAGVLAAVSWFVFWPGSQRELFPLLDVLRATAPAKVTSSAQAPEPAPIVESTGRVPGDRQSAGVQHPLPAAVSPAMPEASPPAQPGSGAGSARPVPLADPVIVERAQPVAKPDPLLGAAVAAQRNTPRVKPLVAESEKPSSGQTAGASRQSALAASRVAPKVDVSRPPSPASPVVPCTPAVVALGLCASSTNK